MNKKTLDISLRGLKVVVLQVLHEKQEEFPTPVYILTELGIPLVKDTKGSETTLVRGILAHLKNDGYAVYNSNNAGWQITEKGVKFIEDYISDVPNAFSL